MKRAMGAVGRFDCLERHSSVAIDQVKKYAPPCGQGEYKQCVIAHHQTFYFVVWKVIF